MKSTIIPIQPIVAFVALFARAWIEIKYHVLESKSEYVALFARAWIEITWQSNTVHIFVVALFARAWIEIFPH